MSFIASLYVVTYELCTRSFTYVQACDITTNDPTHPFVQPPPLLVYTPIYFAQRRGMQIFSRCHGVKTRHLIRTTGTIVVQQYDRLHRSRQRGTCFYPFTTQSYHQDLALSPSACHASSTSPLFAKLKTAEVKTFTGRRGCDRMDSGRATNVERQNGRENRTLETDAEGEGKGSSHVAPENIPS